MPAPPEPIDVSIVVPVRNESDSIDAFTAGLAEQTVTAGEVLFVDGGSTDDTRDRLRAIVKVHPGWRLISAGQATPGRGRNVGARSACMPWIAFTDAGTRADRAWLASLLAAARREPDAQVVWGTFHPVTDTFFTRCAALAYGTRPMPCPGGHSRGPATISMLIRRDLWETVGGFPDLRAGEDLLFFQKIKAHGARAAWAPDATVGWRMQPGFTQTFRRLAEYSRANVKGGLERFWHYGVLRQYVVLSLLAVLAALHDWRWALVIPAAIAARTAKSIWVRAERDRVQTLLNPAVFLTVLAILLTTDMATFAGWAQAIADKRRERG